jgi:hypothetical protein
MCEQTFRIRTWGFRFFLTDAFVIGALATALIALKRSENPMWWLLAVVGAHFFLFCNVIRMRRGFELTWSGGFLLNAGAWLWLEKLTIANFLACQLPLTAVLLIAEVRSPRYHGVLARQLNPALDEYLKGRQ